MTREPLWIPRTFFDEYRRSGAPALVVLHIDRRQVAVNVGDPALDDLLKAAQSYSGPMRPYWASKALVESARRTAEAIAAARLNRGLVHGMRIGQAQKIEARACPADRRYLLILGCRKGDPPADGGGYAIVRGPHGERAAIEQVLRTGQIGQFKIPNAVRLWLLELLPYAAGYLQGLRERGGQTNPRTPPA